MRMKTFQADTMQEALTKVKDEMGPDAVILKSRKSTWKVNNKVSPCFEVTAALEESLFAKPGLPAAAAPNRAKAQAATPAPPRAAVPPVGGETSPRGVYDWKGGLRRVDDEGNPQDTAPSRSGRAQEAPGPTGSLLELLRHELREVKEKMDTPSREIQILKNEIKAMVETVADMKSSAEKTRPATGPGATDFASPGVLPPELRAIQAYLVEMDLDSEYATEIAFSAARSGLRAPPTQKLTSPLDAKAHDVLQGAMASRIRTTGGVRLRPGKPSVIAMVGPTGAGKTTTLCKLAALAKLHQGKQVGILSADSFRMGANEQLELFGRTAGIPVRPVFSSADVIPGLREFANCDLILVDTAGRSHSHPESWVEMQALLRALSPDEIHLVLSCTTRMREMVHQAGLYGGLFRYAAASGLICTKLDECLSLGNMYNLARRLETPFSYLCDGQVIPDHISLATPQGVAAKVLHGCIPQDWNAGHPTLAG